MTPSVDIVDVSDLGDGTLKVAANVEFRMLYPPSYADYTEDHQAQMTEWIQARILGILNEVIVESPQPPITYA